MKQILTASIALLFIFLPEARANTGIRFWKDQDGKSFQAFISGWDAESDIVTLSRDNGEKFTISRARLSLADQAFVRQWFNNHAKLNAKLKEAGGKLVHLQTTGTWTTDYYVYQPSNFRENDTFPMLILFNAGGRGYEMMLRHFEAAEKAGILLVTTDYFKNKVPVKEMQAHFEEMLPQLETLSHDPQKLFLGGSSGGAVTAYQFSAFFDRPWAGIYANGGWLGNNYKLSYRSNMRVAMINGHKDRGALTYTEADTKHLVEKHNANVAVFSFEGGHQLAPSDSQVEAFEWLLEKRKSAVE